MLLADLGGHADVRGDDALDLVVMNQLRDAEELLAAGAGRAAHVVGDQGEILGAELNKLFDDGAGLAAGQEAAAHDGGAIRNHFRCLSGSQHRFLCHFFSSYSFL